MSDDFEKGKKFINKEIASRNLEEVTRVFRQNNIPLILIFGTLLGAIRENDFITYDNDIDLAAFFSDKDYILKVIKGQLPSFEIQDVPFKFDINLVRDGEKIELWLFEPSGDNYVYDPLRCKGITYHKSFFDNPGIRHFKGYDVSIPNMPVEFLKLTYGNDWNIPNQNGQYILGKK